MSSYYSNSSDQRGGIMPSIYVRDAGQIQYPDSSSVQHNMLYANYSDSLPITSQSQQHYIQLPASSSITSQEQFPGGPENAYSIYNSSSRDGRSEMLLMQTIGGPNISAENFVQSSHLGILDGQKLSLQQPKGLSLSLGTEIPVQSFQYQTPLISGLPGPGRDESPRHSHVHMNSSPFGIPNFASAIPNSKYLKAAQELLEQVVNVREALKQKTERSLSLHNSTDGGSKSEKATSNPQESTENSSPEISPSERQELQNKVTKLLAMLDEVDRRYKQYYHQMQLVVSSFDAIAGQGAAKPYTALALQTISRHFRCLRDAITTQIKNARKTLGEKESSGGNGVGISRLRYIEQQIRQQRAMQQFGMMQPHAWRPQRGLPENSVSILRAWLFEHFLHPYPKDSEKLMLAKQTGLTRGQVANWFINARVRLWKPMIEEMYKEEIGDTEVDSNNSSSENNNNNNNNPPKVHNEMKSSEDMEEAQLSAAGSDRCQTSQFNHNHFKSNLMPDSNISVDDPYMNIKLRDQISNGENCSILQEALGHSDGNERLMAYQMGEMSRFGNSGVSLTLGLQGGGLPISDGHQNFMSMREEDMYGSDQPPSIGREDFEYMNVGDQRHRFGPSHLLHDFVA